MHFEFLVEDISGKRTLETLIPKIIGEDHTFNVISYKGIGRIPKHLNAKTDPTKRILLQELPRLLRGYGKSYAHDPGQYAVVVVCDLDDRCLKEFREELLDVLSSCDPRPNARFCIAIEEGEAWLLGDQNAVFLGYPKAKSGRIDAYVCDAICGTWELLADAVHPGGSNALKQSGWQAVGAAKSAWAENISPHVRIEENKSPSFQYFCSKLKELERLAGAD